MLNVYSKFLDFFYYKRSNISDFLRELFATSFVRVFIAVIIVVNIIIWAIVRKIIIIAGDNGVVLHYNVDKGIDLYGKASQIYFLPLFGLCVFIFNFLIFSIINKKKDKVFIISILFGSALFVNIILVMAVISLYIVNFGQ